MGAIFYCPTGRYWRYELSASYADTISQTSLFRLAPRVTCNGQQPGCVKVKVVSHSSPALPVRAAVLVGATGRWQLTIARPIRDVLERAGTSRLPDNAHRAFRPERRAGEQQRPDIAATGICVQLAQAK